MNKINEPNPPRPTSPPYSFSQEPEFNFTSFEIKPRFFKVPYSHKSTQTTAVNPIYPHPIDTKAPPVEKKIIKLSLSEDALSKWHLFEKTFQVDLGNETTLSSVRSHFRKFLKRHHPDLTSDKKVNFNFATLVKIKDELITVVK